MSKLIDPTKSKIPMWVVKALTTSQDRETMKQHICGFYLDEEYADLVVELLSKEEYGKGLRYREVWKDEIQANHMWIWNISDGV